jgi:hypothetical protein
MCHDLPLLDANEPEQLLTQLTSPSAVVGESELGSELSLDRTAVVAREPSSDVPLLCLELADLSLELFALRRSTSVSSRRMRAP